MPTRFVILSALSLTLAACQSPDGGTSPVSTAGAGGSLGASGQASTPLSAAKTWQAPAKAEVWELAVTTRPKAGGPTLADVDQDQDPNDDVEPEVDVEVKAGDWAAVGTIEARGHSTREAHQMSYKIKLAKDAAPWHGYTSLQLNKHPYDLTRMRNKLAFDMLAYLPELAASTTQFVHVIADGRDLGLFTMVEKVDKDYLKAHQLDEKGWLYKAEEFEFGRYPEKLKLTTAPGYDKKAFESVLGIEGSKDHQPLLTMLDAVNDGAQSDAEVFGRHFDRRNFVSWLAFNVLTGNQDTSTQNYFLYRPNNGPWYFLPWDYDGAWGFYDQPNEKVHGSMLARWQEGLPNWWGSALVRRFLKQPGALAELEARVSELKSTVLTRDHIQALTASYADAVAPYVAKAPDAAHMPLIGGDAAAEWQAEVARVAGVVEANAATFDRTKLRPMPFYLSDPEAADGRVSFGWDASYSLAGHGLTYDLEVSKDPGFGAVAASKKGLTEPSASVDGLAPGAYFVRVTARDATDPTTLYQYAFDRYEAGGQRYDGVKAFTVQ